MPSASSSVHRRRHPPPQARPTTGTGNEILERARALFGEMQREYAAGNFARYGELLQQLGKLLLPPH